MPRVPDGCDWRNPVRDYDYVRSEWDLFRLTPEGSIVLASVKVGTGGFSVSRPGAKVHETTDATEALSLAAEAAHRNAG